jgi:hypothetical protein
MGEAKKRGDKGRRVQQAILAGRTKKPPSANKFYRLRAGTSAVLGIINGAFERAKKIP